MQVYICTVCQQLQVLETADASLHFAHLNQPLLGLKLFMQVTFRAQFCHNWWRKFTICTFCLHFAQLHQPLRGLDAAHANLPFAPFHQPLQGLETVFAFPSTTTGFRNCFRESAFHTTLSTTTGFRSCLRESTLCIIPSTAPGFRNCLCEVL